MPVQGTETLAKNILAFGGGFKSQVNAAMEDVRGILDDRVKKNIGLKDHSLKDLARMGHPYAKRAPQAIHSPSYQVHEQSGDLMKSRYSGVNKADITGGRLFARAYVGLDPEKAPHALDVVYGTSKMVPRDPLVGSLGEVKERVLQSIKVPLRGAVVNFNGKKVRL